MIGLFTAMIEDENMGSRLCDNASDTVRFGAEAILSGLVAC
jgi:hypothetical protein